jgi:pyruvate dehydrogenase phosphatase
LFEGTAALEYPANDPIEDRYTYAKLNGGKAVYAAVFDGHSGWQVSELARKSLHIHLDEALKNATTDEEICNAIRYAYDKVEEEWYKFAGQAYELGFPKAAYVGSCALVALVKNGKLYIANAGDSKGALLRKKKDGTFESIKVSTTFNANKKYE